MVAGYNCMCCILSVVVVSESRYHYASAVHHLSAESAYGPSTGRQPGTSVFLGDAVSCLVFVEILCRFGR